MRRILALLVAVAVAACGGDDGDGDGDGDGVCRSDAADPNDPYRPVFHATPPEGWMNDPNGLVFVPDGQGSGEYHLFYQHNPGSALWGAMHWGHAVSTDLVRWQPLDPAIYPDAERGQAWSGSAVLDPNTSGVCAGEECIVALFTRAGGADDAQKQSLAWSDDGGRTFEELPTPVIANPGIDDFRDPKVIPWADGWRAVIAAGDRAYVYASEDLGTWTKVSELGPYSGLPAGEWECPDLFDVDGRWVLKVDVNTGILQRSETRYWIGEFDGAAFTPVTPEAGLPVDGGPDFYAAQTWAGLGDRRLWIAWMDNWQYALATPADYWRGAMTVPREPFVVDTTEGPRLAQRPAPELQTLRSECSVDVADIALPYLPDIDGDALELEIEAEATELVVAVRVGAGEETLVGWQDGTLWLDRSKSGTVDFAPGFEERAEAPLAAVDGTIRLHVLVDRSSVEVFGGDGTAVVTALVFPAIASRGVELRGTGTIRRLRAWPLSL